VTPRLILGVGSPHGDDRAGWLVIDELHQLGYPADRARHLQQPAALWDVAAGETRLVVCDAAAGCGPPGTTRCFLWPVEQVPRYRPGGTHDLSLAEVLEVLRLLFQPTVTVEVWVIEGAHWAAGSAPSTAVRAAARRLAEQLRSSL
jgi:hydrogenase maturation protease